MGILHSCIFCLLIFYTCKCIFGRGYTAQLHFLFANFFILANIFLGVGILHSCIFLYPGKESGIQLLIGLAPFSQIVGSLLRAPGLQSRLETLGKMWVWWIHFNWKIHAITFLSNAFGKVKNLTNYDSTSFSTYFFSFKNHPIFLRLSRLITPFSLLNSQKQKRLSSLFQNSHKC